MKNSGDHVEKIYVSEKSLNQKYPFCKETSHIGLEFTSKVHFNLITS